MTNREGYRLVTALLEITPSADTKLEHARNQTLKNAQEFVEKYNEKIKDLSIDFCATNEKGHILRDQHGAYVFTKENERALEKAVKEFLDEPLVCKFEIVGTDDTKGLSIPLVQYFREAGFVLHAK